MQLLLGRRGKPKMEQRGRGLHLGSPADLLAFMSFCQTVQEPSTNTQVVPHFLSF